MSSSTYCQGLQSCLDTRNQAEPRVLRLKLAPPKCSSNSPNSSSTDKNVDMGGSGGGWTFLQSLDIQSSTKINNTDQKDKIYTPPNCNSPGGGSLSEESLEMCTERLGSESGNDGGFEEEFALLSADENVQFIRPTKRIAEKETCNYKFPPPLTSISGGQNVHVKPHREGGRLVLEAVAVSSRHCFQAERSDGRLRLHLLENLNYSSICTEAEEEEAEEAEEAEEEEEEFGEEVVDEEVDDEKELIDGNVESTEIGNLGRQRRGRGGRGRCKEGGESGNKGSCCFFSSEAFWVAT